ncbi:unnamed protein product [Rotaria sordida]|uniref:Kinesin light chain n=2 Tax=Rotaria sordida TaxID=392033 RepID=A0A819D0G0_9BILA|nr:unnamed protein product [Rotaria sordida]
MGCGASAGSTRTNSASTDPQPTTKAVVTPSSSSFSTLLNQQLDSNRIPKRDRRTDTNEIIQNFLLIWLDAKTDESNEDYHNSIKHLRRTVNTIKTFQDTEECIDYISKLQNEKAFLIISGALCQTVVPCIHNMTQLYAIYVFCRKQEKYEEWAKDWSKVKGIFIEIILICNVVQQSARQCDEDSIIITGISSLNKIEPSFMYTQLFKEIILEINFDEKKEINDLTDYARENLLGLIKYNQGEYNMAVEFYEKALDIYEKTLPPNHPDLAASYNNIGLVYDKMGEYSKTLSSYERSLEIRKIALPPNHSDLAASYLNIGSVHYSMGEYSKALSSYERSLEIQKLALPPNHPDLASSYSGIGLVYDNMREYSKALSSYERSLEIRNIALPSNHPDLAASYNNIGLVYDKMGEYSKALSSYERSLQIRKIALSPNHPDLATSCNNIGSVYSNMGEYSKALSYYEKAQEIWKKSLPPTHPHIALVKSNIDIIKKKL